MQYPVVNIRTHDTKLVYTGFSNLAAQRLGMSEDSLVTYLLARGIMVTENYLVTLANPR